MAGQKQKSSKILTFILMVLGLICAFLADRLILKNRANAASTQQAGT